MRWLAIALACMLSSAAPLRAEIRVIRADAAAPVVITCGDTQDFLPLPALGEQATALAPNRSTPTRSEGDPIQTVIAMFDAFERRDAEGWVAAMSQAYHFDSDDPSFARSHPAGFGRDDESAFATHLFRGGKRGPDGRELPTATRVDAPLGSVWVEMREFSATRATAHVERYAFVISLSDGSSLALEGSDNVIELAREGDAWRVVTWHERVNGSVPLAESSAVATAAADRQASPASTRPARLAIRTLDGLQSSAIALELALPGSGGVVELFDVAGRRITRHDLTGMAAGTRRVELPTSGVPKGTYWARVQQAGAVATTRVVRLR